MVQIELKYVPGVVAAQGFLVVPPAILFIAPPLVIGFRSSRVPLVEGVIARRTERVADFCDAGIAEGADDVDGVHASTFKTGKCESFVRVGRMMRVGLPMTAGPSICCSAYPPRGTRPCLLLSIYARLYPPVPMRCTVR